MRASEGTGRLWPRKDPRLDHHREKQFGSQEERKGCLDQSPRGPGERTACVSRQPRAKPRSQACSFGLQQIMP